MADIVLTGDTSGAITVAAPAVAGTNTITLPAETGTIVTSTSAATNTPAFSAELGTAQTLTNITVTKALFDNQLFDTDNAFDTSTNRFTVPTGKAGIYSISAHLRLATSASNLNLAVLYIYKNNAIAKYAYNNNASNPLSANSIALTTLLDLNVGDYLEIFAYMQGAITASGLSLNTGQHTVFCGHRLIT